MKIDIFPHIVPIRYWKVLTRRAKPGSYRSSSIDATPMALDLALRFRVMDDYSDLVQVLTLGGPPIEQVADPKTACELAQIANDEMAELVAKYPDRFVAAVAALPMNDIDAALVETDRAINNLGFKGIQISTPVIEKPLDSPEFMPFYEKMDQYGLPIWIHPTRTVDHPDYGTEDKSLYSIHSVFGWPYETSAAMTRLVFSGILQRWPKLKIITHHCGAMVSFFEQRIASFYEKQAMMLGKKYELAKAPSEYYKMFYNDTALYGGTPALMCAYAFFGAGHLLFGTDMPLGDGQGGARNTRETIDAIGRMDISPGEKKMIFEDNARNILKL